MARMVCKCACCGKRFIVQGKKVRSRKSCSAQCHSELCAIFAREQVKKSPRGSGKFVKPTHDDQLPGPNDPTPEEILQRKNEIRAAAWRQRCITQ